MKATYCLCMLLWLEIRFWIHNDDIEEWLRHAYASAIVIYITAALAMWDVYKCICQCNASILAKNTAMMKRIKKIKKNNKKK